MKKIEILAPAGNLDSLLAGIHSGADAVYFGYGELNARRNAKNFDEQSLAEASRLCKERGVKMHMTVNTMVYDREYDEVLRTLEIACKYGIDALIVQDLGVKDCKRSSSRDEDACIHPAYRSQCIRCVAGKGTWFLSRGACPRDEPGRDFAGDHTGSS